MDTSGGEICHFRDTMFCVGFGNRRVVALVADPGSSSSSSSSSGGVDLRSAFAGFLNTPTTAHPADNINNFFSRRPFIPSEFNVGGVGGVAAVPGSGGSVGFGPNKARVLSL